MADCDHLSRTWNGDCDECAYARGREEERRDVVADLTAAADVVEGRHRSVFDGAIAKTLRDAAARYASGEHVVAAAKEDK